MSFYNPDVHTPKVVAFMGQHSGQLILSDWAKVEMSSALGIQVRRGDISQTLAMQLLATFRQHCASFYKRVGITGTHFVEAERLLQTLTRKLRSADALHLAVAKLEHLTLVTLDNDLADVAKEEGVTTMKV